MIQEIELKYRFSSQRDFMDLMSLIGGKPEEEQQTNYFFDTKVLSLKQAHYYLRIRKSNDLFFFTSKGPALGFVRDNERLSAHDEWEVELETQLAFELLSGQRNIWTRMKEDWPQETTAQKQTRLSLLDRMSAFGSEKEIGLVGSFSNLRTHVPYYFDSYELDFEFDATDFGNNRIDYEVELELPEGLEVSRAEALIDGFLKQLKITPLDSQGKAERFFEGYTPKLD